MTKRDQLTRRLLKALGLPVGMRTMTDPSDPDMIIWKAYGKELLVLNRKLPLAYLRGMCEEAEMDQRVDTERRERGRKTKALRKAAGSAA